MELVTLACEMVQSGAERVASYRAGQVVLRQADRVLWALEKSATWAVPPPLDQDERAQPELVRPLPWVFFLALLVTLRITRESISLVNLIMGKQPLRSADVVTYIQSKRRYLRTLKYQGNRMMRARSAGHPRETWYTQLQTMLEYTLCFRRPYTNNNSTRVSNNEEVLVVKRSKRPREPAPSENTMERLIEKMMVDLDADTDDDSSYTLTNPASMKSDSDLSESEQEGAKCPHSPASPPATPTSTPATPTAPTCSTPNKDDSGKNTTTDISYDKTNSIHDKIDSESPEKATKIPMSAEKSLSNSLKKSEDKSSLSQRDAGDASAPKGELDNGKHRDREQPAAPAAPASPGRATESFLDNERQKRTPKKSQKIANGRTIESSQSKKRENSRQGQRNH